MGSLLSEDLIFWGDGWIAIFYPNGEFFFFFFMLSCGSSPLIFFTFSPFDEKILDIGKKSYSSITIKQTGAYCFSE